MQTWIVLTYLLLRLPLLHNGCYLLQEKEILAKGSIPTRTTYTTADDL